MNDNVLQKHFAKSLFVLAVGCSDAAPPSVSHSETHVSGSQHQEETPPAATVDDEDLSLEAVIEVAARQHEDGEVDLAIATLNKAVAAFPDSDRAYHVRGILFSELDRLDDAVQDFTQAVSRAPRNIKAILERGDCYARLMNYTEAESDFTSVIELIKALETPENPKPKAVHELLSRAYMSRGNVYSAQRRDADAAEDYTKSIKEDSGNIQAYLGRSNCHKMTGDENAAMDDLNEAIERIETSDATVDQKNGMLSASYMGRAFIHESRKEFQQAFSQFDRAIELDPTKYQVLMYRGELHLKTGNGEKARVDIERAFAAFPESPAVLIAKIKLETDKEFGTPESVEGLFEKLFQLSKTGEINHLLGLSLKGEWLLEQKQYAAGLECLEKCIAIERDPPDLNWIAWTLATCPDDAIRNGKRAVELAEEACKLSDRNEANYVDTLAAAYAENGDFEKAIEFQQEALLDADYESEFGDEARARLAEYKVNMPHREE